MKITKAVQITRSSPRLAPPKRKLPPWKLEPFSQQELHSFLAILFYAAQVNCRKLRDLWSVQRKRPSHTFVRSHMGRDRFLLMYGCYKFTEQQVMEFEGMVNPLIQSIWIPSTYVVIDESLIPFKGRKNPHHVFIMRKPHPHGTKVHIEVDSILILREIQFQSL